MSASGCSSLSACRFFCPLAVAVLMFPTVCLTQSAPADSACGSVWGRVVRATNDRPIRHARVELLIPSTGWASSTLTDGDGKFDFAGLSRATYQVTVTEPGYERLDSTAEIAGKTGPLVLRLGKMEAPATPRNTSPVNDNVVSVQELRSPGKSEKAFDKGVKLLLRGDAAGSIAYFDRAIARDPSYYRAYYDKGLAYFRLGNTAEAEQAFQKTIDLTGGGYAPADFLMGLILCQMRQFREAETVIQKGLEIDPGSALGKVFLGWTQFALNRPADAERSAQQALFRKANLPEAYYLLAQIHHAQHNSPAVVADLQTYFRLDPNGPESNDAKALLATAQQEMN
jgi:tetratricopeptide (TPR) repeat protein